MDLLLLALEIPETGFWAAIIGGSTTLAAGLKVLWAYWTNREKEKIERYKEILDAKDETIGEKDERITELQKELSKKSDAHAKKIQELMGVTLQKVEEMGDKQNSLTERAITVMADFSAHVQRMNLESG